MAGNRSYLNIFRELAGLEVRNKKFHPALKSYFHNTIVKNCINWQNKRLFICFFSITPLYFSLFCLVFSPYLRLLIPLEFILPRGWSGEAFFIHEGGGRRGTVLCVIVLYSTVNTFCKNNIFTVHIVLYRQPNKCHGLRYKL